MGRTLSVDTNAGEARSVIYTSPWALEGFPGGSDGKEAACNAGNWVQSLGWEDAWEKKTATHSGVLALRIPWTEEPGRLQSMESQRVRHN